MHIAGIIPLTVPASSHVYIYTYVYIYGGFLKWGYPKMDGFQRTILLKWMMTGGTPSLGNLHIYIHIYLYLYIHTSIHCNIYTFHIYIYMGPMGLHGLLEYRPLLKWDAHVSPIIS